MVNPRSAVALGLTPSQASLPVEWQTSRGLVPYEAALAAMDARAHAIAAGTASELVWLLEHPPLYTAGTSARPGQLIDAKFPVHAAGRGGQFTYHGPGQRIAYVMLDLRRRGADVRRLVATLEEWIIRTLRAFEIAGERREDRIGVWVRRPQRGSNHEDKIAAIGIRVKRWVTLHGIAINLDCRLSHYAGIVPCGVSAPGLGVTSFADLGLAVRMPELDRALHREFEPLFGAAVMRTGVPQELRPALADTGSRCG